MRPRGAKGLPGAVSGGSESGPTPGPACPSCSSARTVAARGRDGSQVAGKGGDLAGLVR